MKTFFLDCSRVALIGLAMTLPLVVAASSTAQESDQAVESAGTQSQPDSEYHETLKPLAQFVGRWRSERRSATGELKSIRNDKYSWLHEGRAMRLEWTEKSLDGDLKASASYIFYFDGAERKIKFLGTGSYGIVEGGTLASNGDNGLMWNVYFIFANGNQGRFKFRSHVQDDGKRLTLGWSKISGSGSNELGPFEYERID
ncbi:hypothetical protein NZK35_19970 [Stieleria sp. ICT_E10.1]|uniref:hypothetical protein n=1 Tax=Stieleria sedimenti TaxID=2976331 RepID=UPI00217FF307|nr:hypothetical protein [Stieleria sedimenti]MCS7468936.1 hypothetical protein [Stieleria sedimenti]